MKKYIVLLICYTFFSPLLAQEVYREVYASWEEFMEYYSDNEEETENNEIEQLMHLTEQPININTADRVTLCQLPFLSEAQIDSLIAYRERKKLLLTLGELQFISGWDATSRRFASLFTYAGDTLHPKISLLRQLSAGKHHLSTRIDIPTYKRKGVTQQRDGYLGDGIKNVTRYRYAYKDATTYGVTLEKDAGEPFATQGNNPFDYWSAYFTHTSQNKRHRYILGDFTLHFGEGLVFGKKSFSGQLGLLQSPQNSQMRIKEHTGTDEHNFYRGAAYSFTHHNMRLTTFASYRTLDAKIENDKAVTLYTDGEHRTHTELVHKNTLTNLTLGAMSEWKLKNLTCGIVGYVSHYNKEVFPTLRDYNTYYFRGDISTGGSFTYTYQHGTKLQLKGELATDQRLHLSYSNRIYYKATNTLQLVAQLRWFSKRYVAPFAHTINFASQVANEQGVMIGTKWKMANNRTIEAYIDTHHFPYSTYRASRASHGAKAYLQFTKYHKSGSNSLLRYTYRLWQQDYTGKQKQLIYKGKHRLRLQHAHNHPQYSITGIIEASATHSQTSNAKYGYGFAVRGLYRPTNQFSCALFATLFSTDNYETSIYAYEPLLPGMYSFGALYYKGMRTALQVTYKWTNGITAGLRYGVTHYFNRSTISSGLQEINSSSKGDFNVYLSVRL